MVESYIQFTLSVMVNQLLSIKPEDPARLYVLQDFLSYMKGFISLPIPLPGTAYTNAIKVRYIKRNFILNLKKFSHFTRNKHLDFRVLQFWYNLSQALL